MYSIGIILRRYTFLMAAFCLAVAYILPFFTLPWALFYHEYVVAVSLLLLALALSLYVERFLLRYMVIFLIGIACLPLLQWAIGTIYFLGDGVLVSLYLFGAVLAIICGQTIVDAQLRHRSLLIFSWVFFFLGFVNVFFALTQFFNLDITKDFLAPIPQPGRSYGNLRQSNNFSSLIVISLLCSWYLFEKRLFSRKVFWFWIFFITIGLVLSQSRTTLLVGVVVCLFYFIKRRNILFRLEIVDWVVIAFCYLFWYFLVVYLKYYLSLELFSVDEGEIREFTLYSAGRLGIWYESIKALMDVPLWGYGWNQIGVAQVLVDSDLESKSHFRHSHNVFLDILLYTGPLIGPLIIVFIVRFAWQAFYSCKTIEDWIILALIAALWVHAMLELPLHYAYFLLPMMFLVGLVDIDKKPSGCWYYSPYFNIPVVAVGVIALALLLHDYLIIEREDIRRSLELKGFPLASKLVEESHNIVLLTHQHEYFNFGRAEAKADMSSEKIEWMKKVSHRFASTYYLAKYAKACQLNARYDEAVRVHGVIRRLFGEDLYIWAKGFIYGEVEVIKALPE